MGFRTGKKLKVKFGERKTPPRLFGTLKSQAPVEFMTVYFWALLVIVLTIGALWYLGVLSPSKKLLDRCTIGPYIDCKQYLIAETEEGAGVLRLKLKNNFAQTIIVTEWELTTGAQKTLSCTGEPFTGNWEDGTTIDVEFKGCNSQEAGLVLGEKGKVNVKMVYHPAQASSSFSKAVEGEIFASVTLTDVLITEGSGALQCSVTTSCSDTVTHSSAVVFGMSSAIDAIAEIPSLSNYQYKACCTSTVAKLSTKPSNECPSSDVIPLHLSDNTEAHVEKNTQSNYNVNVCLSTDPGTVSCSYRNGVCLADETCLTRISADTDAHVSDCTDDSFPNYICCKLAE